MTPYSWDMECRRCGACCIAPSVSSSIPGMPSGKPAGERCVRLTDDNQCSLYGLPSRPRVCSDFKPAQDTCGDRFDEAVALMEAMEKDTTPASPNGNAPTQ